METYKPKTTVRRCDCPANQSGDCLLPYLAHAEDRKTGGWWSGTGQTEQEAIDAAIRLEASHNA